MACEFYYPLNANANDYSGNARHGTVTGATLQTSGMRGGAYYFPNSLDRITAPALQMASGQQITIEFWQKTPTLVGTRRYFCKGSIIAGGRFFNLNCSTGSNSIRLQFGINASLETAVSLNYFDLNKWIYVVCILDCNNKMVHFYKNGKLHEAVATIGTPLAINTNTNTTIGSYNSASTQCKGYICEAKLWDRILPPAEIYNNYLLMTGKMGGQQ